MSTARLPIRQMVSPPAHRNAAEPNRGTHHTIPQRIYTSAGDGKLEALEETPFPTEDELQALIAEHPELLDGEQIRPRAARRRIIVTREKAIAASAGEGRPVVGRSPDHRPGCGADAGGGEARLEHGDTAHHRRTAPGVRGARLGDLDGGGVCTARSSARPKCEAAMRKPSSPPCCKRMADPDVDGFWEGVSNSALDVSLGSGNYSSWRL